MCCKKFQSEAQSDPSGPDPSDLEVEPLLRVSSAALRGVLAGGLTRQAYSITETAPLFCRHGKNKRRALMRVQEAHLPDSLGPIPPGR